jgi:hypothetical protein
MVSSLTGPPCTILTYRQHVEGVFVHSYWQVEYGSHTPLSTRFHQTVLPVNVETTVLIVVIHARDCRQRDETGLARRVLLDLLIQESNFVSIVRRKEGRVLYTVGCSA